jgi:hypothetical protein
MNDERTVYFVVARNPVSQGEPYEFIEPFFQDPDGPEGEQYHRALQRFYDLQATEDWRSVQL